MIRKVVLTIMGFVWLSQTSLAQTYADVQSYPVEALIISRTMPGGTARVNAMGGVQNALGGDLSTASYNPAGLGMYNRSEFSISPSMNIFSANGSYLNTNTSQSTNHFMIPNLGVALHSPKDGAKGFWGGTFAITYNRINDFNHTYSYKGTNNDNSIIDSFLEEANGGDSSQFSPTGFNNRTGANHYNSPTGLAYYNFLIGPTSVLDPSFPKDVYFTDVSGIPMQTETIKNSGSQNQWNFSYGVNFSDRFYLGAGIGLASFDFKSEKTYAEAFNQAGQPMSRMELKETLSLSGSGFNFTLGTIIRPIDQVQVGLSASTPTSYSITDNYSASMTSAWNNFVYQPGDTLNNMAIESDILTSDYNLKTPWRVSGGVTVFIQKKGFISADGEWLNYGTSAFSSSFGDYSGDNSKIKGLYKSVFNFRVGGEYRLNKYRVRAGYNFMPDPYQTEQNGISNARTTYTFGGGYRADKFYVDLAVMFGQTMNSYRPYTVNLPNSPLVSFENKSTTIMLTFGMPF